MIRTFIVLNILALGIAGCSAKIDGGSGPLPVSLGQGGGSTPTTTVLEGNWNSGCVGSGGVYLTMSATYSGNKSTATVNIFSDSACTQSIQPQQTQSATFTIGSASTVAGATNIDYVSTQGVATYDIFKTDGTTLYFGLQPGNSPGTRPTQLNLSLPLTKN